MDMQHDMHTSVCIVLINKVFSLALSLPVFAGNSRVISYSSSGGVAKVAVAW